MTGSLLLGVMDLADELRVSRCTVHRMIASGFLPARVEIPGLTRRRWLRGDIEQWLADRERESAEGLALLSLRANRIRMGVK